MPSSKQQRAFIGLIFFFIGVSFATWASRIPNIKANFQLNDAELGSLLILMPISSMVSLPFSGWLVSRFNSRKPLIVSIFINALSLMLIGNANSIFLLSVGISGYAFTTRTLNLSLNTQGVNLQKLFSRNILGTFHGLWSAGGIVGAALTTFLLKYHVSIQVHLIAVAILVIIACAFAYPYLIRNDKPEKGNKIIIGKPDPYIFMLGLLAFCAAVCEGGMFDWSGVYFKEVIQTPIFTYGYLTFMTFMAGFRFLSGTIIAKIGMYRNYMLSAGLIFSGIILSIALPYFWAGLIGFALVGAGTASVVPMTYALAGKSDKYAPGMALSIITTYTISGMLIGPPIIGYISHALNLRVSFALFAAAGIMIAPIAHLLFQKFIRPRGIV
ncbi:MFS transporter [Pelobium manganitolerans]|uniref:MFS transporter n=1 Tax=Pelobium manganitolerans TaxID=1842495 RepID=UPI003FA34F75